MKIQTIVCGPLSTNAYVIWKEGETACAVIDPSDAAPVSDFLQEQGLCLERILLTHGHFDHIGGVKRLRDATDAQVCIHEADASMLESETGSLAALANAHMDVCSADRLLRDGDTVMAGSMAATVIHTPGHTTGGVCYWFREERTLFCGDTLFRLSVGRTDLPGADGETLLRSITEKLFVIQGDATVYPGHMRETTLEFERVHNPYVQRYRGERW